MKVFIVCLGFLALAGVVESVLTYVEPLSDGDVGIRGIAPQGTGSGTVYTFDVTTANAYTITTQVPDTIFAISAGGVVSIAATKTVDTVASTTHVLTVEATDGTLVGTMTVTLTVLPIYFMSPQVCYDLPLYSPKGDVHTPAASGAMATITYAQTGTANTGYAVTATTGLVANDAVVISTTTAAKVITYITAVEAFGTASTATQTVYFCVKGGCSCSGLGFDSGSGAASLSVGILTLVSTLLLLKLK